MHDSCAQVSNRFVVAVASCLQSNGLQSLAVPAPTATAWVVAHLDVRLPLLSKERMPMAVTGVDGQSLDDITDDLKCNERIKAAGCHINILHITNHYFDQANKTAYFAIQPAITDLRRLQRSRSYALPQHLSLPLASDMSNGLAYHRKLEIIHRDLKPANMLIYVAPGRGSGLLLKIGDFGCSRLASVRSCQTTGFCTPLYRAPEAIAIVKMAAVVESTNSGEENLATCTSSSQRMSTRSPQASRQPQSLIIQNQTM